MTTVRRWLVERRPPAPDALAEDLALDGDASVSVEGLAAAAGRRLSVALDRPGRVRESAFHLLAADALITYACEAALEREDPDAVLAELIQELGTP